MFDSDTNSESMARMAELNSNNVHVGLISGQVESDDSSQNAGLSYCMEKFKNLKWIPYMC